MLDKNKYKLDENIDFNKEREDWGNARTILSLLEIAEEYYSDLIKDSVITGLMYSRLYTKWENEDSSNKIAFLLKAGSHLTPELENYLSQRIIFLPDYSEENKEKEIKEYDGVIIYE